MIRLTHKATSNVSRRWLQQKHRMRIWNPASVSISAWYSSSGHRSSQKDNDNNNNNDSETPKPKVQAEWIPPNRPLHGDQDHSQLYKTQQDLDKAEDSLFTVQENESEEETLRRLEEALELEERLQQEREKEYAQQDDDVALDWQETKRQALMGTQNTPDQSAEVPIRHHQLLTEDELTTLLKTAGGQDILVIPDDEEYPRMGGADGMVLCTAESSSFFINRITKTLVYHLKERHLDDLGVAGAKMGKHFLLSSPSSSNNNWNVIDCRNYIVHILDAKTRNALNLEELWSGKDPLWKVNTNDEDSLDDYVSEHHVPFAYGPNTEGLYGDAAPNISKLQRQQWLSPQHRPVIPTEQKLKDRRAEKRKRRERKRQEAKEAYYQ